MSRLPLIRRLVDFPLLATGVLFAFTMVAGTPPAGAAGLPFAGYSVRSAVGNCALLPSIDFVRIPNAPAQVTSASIVPAAASVPAFCGVQGYTKQSIRFDLQLPQGWNGRFVFLGCGGYCGSLGAATLPLSALYLQEGFAVATTDTGHAGDSLDGLWSYDDYQAVVNYGHLAIHDATRATLAITYAYYGMAPQKAYFVGGSTGGMEGLLEAQRYPDDFDGIAVEVPSFGSPTINVLGMGYALEQFYNPSGEPQFTVTDIANLHTAVVAACSSLDSTHMGVLDDPTKCHFTPSTLLCGRRSGWCLTINQVARLANIYAGAHTSYGKHLWPGMEPGSEPNWVGAFIGYLPAPTPATGLSAVFPLVGNAYYWLAFDQPKPQSFNPLTFNFDDWPQLVDRARLWMPEDPNLAPFRAHGGKLFMTAGWADQVVFSLPTVDYYNRVQKTLGNTANFLRLFMIPGQGHGVTVTPAVPTNYDPLGIVQRWRENGQAPSQLLITALNAQGKVTNSRVLYPYPHEPAGYTGPP